MEVNVTFELIVDEKLQPFVKVISPIQGSGLPGQNRVGMFFDFDKLGAESIPIKGMRITYGVQDEPTFAEATYGPPWLNERTHEDFWFPVEEIQRDARQYFLGVNWIERLLAPQIDAQGKYLYDLEPLGLAPRFLTGDYLNVEFTAQEGNGITLELHMENAGNEILPVDRFTYTVHDFQADPDGKVRIKIPVAEFANAVGLYRDSFLALLNYESHGKQYEGYGVWLKKVGFNLDSHPEIPGYIPATNVSMDSMSVSDAAMLNQNKKHGGIDFNSQNLNLDEQGQRFKFDASKGNFDPAQLQNLQGIKATITGVETITPTILNKLLGRTESPESKEDLQAKAGLWFKEIELELTV